ncbi:N-acetyltransferase [Paenibacillus psychroresistens]|uniref:N-acetyltransferase n=1 Tax=Paenibacillus psychroresistens TaxID=1778678 RepID=A0A6B8RGZ9_9BACL|nr:GNAT family N-acetyltransferase [Paenibacillus psychroresistens]QGQ95460.1 N-acetyltransferase [Paenibacillus psychroresistens]
MGIKIIEALTESQILELAELYKQEGWTKDRKLADIKSMLTHSKIIGLIDEEANKLVGFTRILTDYIYRATIFDVIVLKEYQGQGLGRLLMETLVNHPLLKNIERVDLYTSENMIEFYNKWDFNVVSESTKFLRKTNQQ